MSRPSTAPVPRRSALYVPASNQRAIAKASQIDCDAVIFDLEDAVAPGMKDEARANLVAAFAKGRPARRLTVIRTNAIGSADFLEDFSCAARCRADALLVPKIAGAVDFLSVSKAAREHALDQDIRLWIMIETVEALCALDAIGETGIAASPRLDCLVVGTNDIAKETGVFPGDERRYLMPWLMSVVLCGKRWGVGVLDGVWNDFSDRAGFDREAAQSARMAFDGKTLIHPSQVAPANAAFSPSPAALDEAREIVAAFARDANAAAGVINLNGKMVERLHLAQAERLLELQGVIEDSYTGGAAGPGTNTSEKK